MSKLRSVFVAAITALVAVVMLPSPAQASPWVHVWIESTSSGLCAQIPNASDGAVPTQESCLDIGNQLWTFEDISAGVYRIKSTGTAKCLAANGLAAVQQLTCGSATAQRWTLSGSGNTFRIRSVSAVGKCLAHTNNVAGSQLVLGGCTILVGQWKLLF